MPLPLRRLRLRRRVCWCVMLACHYERHTSDLSAVRVSEIARPPPPSPSQLLVRVRAAALNPADWKTAQGEQALLLSFAWPRVFGFDFAGTVAAVGGSSATLPRSASATACLG